VADEACSKLSQTDKNKNKKITDVSGNYCYKVVQQIEQPALEHRTFLVLSGTIQHGTRKQNSFIFYFFICGSGIQTEIICIRIPANLHIRVQDSPNLKKFNSEVEGLNIPICRL
jgi:hypothetical protein